MWLSQLSNTSTIKPVMRPGWRWALTLPPALLMLLVLMSLIWLPWKTQKLESNERQEQLVADTLWVEQSLRLQLARDEEALHQLGGDILAGRLTGAEFSLQTDTLLGKTPEILRLEWLDANQQIVGASDEPSTGGASMSIQSVSAAESARRTGTPRYSTPPAPAPAQQPPPMTYHLPLMDGKHYRGSLVATYSMTTILDAMVPWWFAQDNEITITGSDDRVIVRRTAGGPGRNVYTHAHVLDLPGADLTLRTNSLKFAPKLLPNLLIGLVLALTLALVGSLVALWRDIKRRLDVEETLRQQVSFRTAMENSLVTGLRARDLDGRVIYVNPAFCQMVGTQADELVGGLPPMSYWAPEAMADYQGRFSQVLAGTITPQGFETIFQRAGGKRFPVLIFESPLLDESGRQTGWMGSILDISDRKRMEDLNLQQQEKLASSARLASMGEIASTLAHELNQPLAAISSYTTGALNLLSDTHAAVDVANLRLALERASTQAQRAGHIIRSVNAFVKQREPAREAVPVRALIDGIMPLIELQAHKFFVGLQIRIAPGLPPILADRVLIEQVLLNLTRNAIEAMEHTPPEHRILTIRAWCDAPDPDASPPASGADRALAPVHFAVTDRGHGITPEIGARLFSSFFSTKAEGMGMGLNICRTAIEFHGGQLTPRSNPKGGTIFEFSLPAALQTA